MHAETTQTTYVPGDVLNYIPQDSVVQWHCREGVAIVGEDGRARDTYWGDSGDRHVLTDQELATAELRFRLGDFRKLGEHWDNTYDEWKTYAPADRQVITSQRHLQRTHYVRIGAEPDLETQIENAREAVAEAEREVESAQRRLEWKREDLAKLEARNG